MNLPDGYKYSIFESTATTSGRVVVVLDRKKRLVDQADPYPEGIPVQPFRRKQLERQTAMNIIKEVED